MIQINPCDNPIKISVPASFPSYPCKMGTRGSAGSSDRSAAHMRDTCNQTGHQQSPHILTNHCHPGIPDVEYSNGTQAGSWADSQAVAARLDSGRRFGGHTNAALAGGIRGLAGHPGKEAAAHPAVTPSTALHQQLLRSWQHSHAASRWHVLWWACID